MRSILFAAAFGLSLMSTAAAQEKPEGAKRRGPGANADESGSSERPGLLQRGAGRRGDRPAPGLMGQGAGPLMRAFPLFTALDADGNGELSPSEIENASKAISKLDKNGDGKITAEEMRPDPKSISEIAARLGAGAGANGPGGEGGGPAMIARMFDSRDTNGDGKLSGDEIPERLRNRIDAIDKDGDGAVSKEELSNSASMLRERMEGGRGPESRRGEGSEGPVRPRRPDSVE